MDYNRITDTFLKAPDHRFTSSASSKPRLQCMLVSELVLFLFWTLGWKMWRSCGSEIADGRGPVSRWGSQSTSSLPASSTANRK